MRWTVTVMPLAGASTRVTQHSRLLTAMAPEGAATWKALLHLRQLGIVHDHESILLMNTGSGYKYLENLV